MTEFMCENPLFTNGGNVLRLERLMEQNRVLFNGILQDSKDTFHSPFVTDIWQLAVLQRHEPVWGYARPRWFNKNAASAADFSAVLRQNRNKVAERFFDGAGSLYVVLFDRHEGHWQNVMPAASAAHYATLAQQARVHDARPQRTSSAFLNLLLTHWERLSDEVQIPPTPSETSEDSSSPNPMDVDATEPDPEGASSNTEGANQIRFLQRHNAENVTVSQPALTEDANHAGDYPWASRIE